MKLRRNSSNEFDLYIFIVKIIILNKIQKILNLDFRILDLLFKVVNRISLIRENKK